MGMKLDGAEVLINHLNRMGKKADKAIEKALLAGGEIIRAEIENEARIKNLISDADKKHMVDYIILSEIVNGEISVGPAKSFFYARFLELGTSHQKATPFIEPAYLRVKDKAQKAINDVIRRELGL